MTAPATEFRQAFLTGRSEKASSIPGLVDGEYDLLIMAASWDSRCLCLLSADVRARWGIGIFFENRGVLGLRDAHDPQVRDYLEHRCETVREIEHASEDLDGLWQELWKGAWEAYTNVGRPLRVLLDVSTCPRYYALALLSGGFRKGIVESVTCFYAEGQYPESREESTHEQFTTGRWKTRDVPFLTGTADPGNSRFYVVSLGFEGAKTYLAVSNNDADRVMVLFPRPGVRPDYPERTRRSNEVLYEEYGLDRRSEISAPAGDAVAAWAALAEASPTLPTENPFYLCCGTKPHAIALALHALIDERVTVLYAQPASHKEAAITPLDSYWAFRIRDLSVPVRRDG